MPPQHAVYCAEQGCNGRVVYEPAAHGMALDRQLRTAVEALKVAVGCEYPTCGGPTGQPICFPCIAFRHGPLGIPWGQ